MSTRGFGDQSMRNGALLPVRTLCAYGVCARWFTKRTGGTKYCHVHRPIAAREAAQRAQSAFYARNPDYGHQRWIRSKA